jgi:hypothetical protein
MLPEYVTSLGFVAALFIVVVGTRRGQRSRARPRRVLGARPALTS